MKSAKQSLMQTSMFFAQRKAIMCLFITICVAGATGEMEVYMRLFRKKSQHSNSTHSNSSDDKNTYVIKEMQREVLEMEFNRFIGQTVTVFVNAGGDAGKGFTGVLMEKTTSCIKLLILPSMPPACSLGNSCSSYQESPLFCALCPFNKKASVGSIAVIPINNIIAFVHNTLGYSKP